MTHLLRKNSPIPAYMAYPRFGNCEKMLQNTTIAMALLQDAPADKYLLQLPEEIIEWAKKDDVEAYISFLHKSFELVATTEKEGAEEQCNCVSVKTQTK